MTTLTALQTIFLRHHNALAELLSNFNTHWDDDKVFQETRRIVVAQIQHITYNEFLPVLLGPEMSQHLTIKPTYIYSNDSTTYYKNYDINVNPGISNEFTIGFQFYVAMMQGVIKKMSPQRDKEEYVQIHNMVWNPVLLKDKVEPNELDKLLMGASFQPVNTMGDSFISGQVN